MIIGDMEIRLRADIARLQRDMDDARRVVGNATAAMGRAADMAKAALAGIAGAVGLSKIAEASDEYSKLTAQLRLATDSTRAYAQAYADVKRIANSSQTDLSATGTLYASLSRATKDLGTSQKSVADITESVNLALKISGSGAQESAGAILQLSQAFASGALRGDEFNSVTDAAPRLMKALADNIGVPVGALRAMAEQGKLTADLVAKALPQALEQLRSEAGQIQTISGAFTVLKNNVMEFTGVQAQASGAVSVLTSGIGLLANNLGVLAGAAATVAAVKLGNWLNSTISSATSAFAANRQLAASTLATAEANATATARASLLASARLEEVRAATLAASGETQLALATNALIPAQARATAAAEAHTVAMGQLTVAQRTASLGASAASTVIGALGGPLGVLITVLGVAATAWSWYKEKQDEATRKAEEQVGQSTNEIVESLKEQNEQMRQRIVLAQKYGDIDATQDTPSLRRLGELQKKIDDLKAQGAAISPIASIELVDYESQFRVLKEVVDQSKEYKATLDSTGKAAADLMAVQQRLTGVNQQYLDDLTKLKTALDKGAISQTDYVAAVSKLAKDTYEGSTAGKAYAQSVDAQAEAIQRAAEAQSLRNQREQEHIQFLQKSGQADEETTIRAAAAAQIKDLNDQIAVQQRLMGVDSRRQETAEQHAQKQAEIQGKIATLRIQIDNAQKKRDEDLLLLDQEKYRQAVNNYGDLLEAAQAQTKTQQDAALDGQDEIDMLGMTSQQIAHVTAARMRDRAALLDQLAAIQDVQDETKRLGDESRKQAEAMRTLADQVVTKEEITRQKELWGQIENTAHDTFISIFDSGKSAFDRLRDALKNGLLELLYQMTLKQWIINIGATTSMTGAAGLAQASGGAADGTGAGTSNPLIGAVGVASNLYKAVTGGFASLSGSMADALQMGFDKIGLSSVFDSAAPSVDLATGVTANGAAASMAGTAAAYGAGMLGGHYLGNAIAGDYSVAHGQTVTNIATAVGAYLLGPIGGVVGGVVGGLFNRAFGMGSKDVTSQGIKGTLTADSLTGSNYASWHQDGGWFRSDKNGTDTTALTDATVKQFTEGLSAIETASSGFAKSLGVSADWVSTYSKTFDIALTGDATKDQQAVTDFFTGVGNEIATRLVPNLADFTKSGETASAALERLAGDFQATDQVAQLIGKTAAAAFGTAGIESAKAREQLVSLAGSASTLTSLAQGYAQNYLTDAEKLAPVQKALDAAMAGLGLSSVQTRDQFKAVVNSLDLTTDAGEKQFVAMMQLADAFAQVHPAADDAATAAQKVADAFNAIKSAGDVLLGDVDNAFSVLQKAVEREKAVVQTAIDAHTAAVSKLQSLSESLHSTLNSMQSPDQQVLARASAQAQIRAVLASVKAGGTLPDADSLKDALGAVTQDASAQFRTREDYLKDLYQTQNDIAQLGDVTDDSLTVEKAALQAAQDQLKSLDAVLTKAQDQIDVLKGQSTTLLSIDQAMAGLATAISAAKANPVVSATSAIANQYQQSLGRAPDAAGLAYWQQQAAAGVSTGDITQAIATSAEATIQGMYKTMLGHAADAAGLQFWLQQVKNGTSLADVGNAIAGSQEALTKVRGYASGGDHAGGWRVVGEYGPELEATGPARIFNAGQTANLMSKLASPSANADALAAAVDRLTQQSAKQQQVIAQLQAAAEQTQRNTKRLADTLDRVTRGGDKMIVGQDDGDKLVVTQGD